MRIVCVQPVRSPATCGNGPVHIGSAPDNDFVLDGVGIASSHASILADARGLVLTVNHGCQRVYVNARAVRERALLHYGDTLTLGGSKLQLTSDVAPPTDLPDSNAGNTPASTGLVTLRIVSGAASGQLLVVAGALSMGAGSRCFPELPWTCTVTRAAAGLWLEANAAGARVNGWPCQRARLGPGDQIALGEHRLIVEAPALQFAANVARRPPPPRPQPAPAQAAPEPASQVGIGWLIVAAAILAAVIAAVLYFHR